MVASTTSNKGNVRFIRLGKDRGSQRYRKRPSAQYAHLHESPIGD